MKKSVAIIGTRGYPSFYGGFETAVRKLAPFLIEQGWDVTVYSRPGATRLDDPARDVRVRSVETRGFEKRSLSTLSYGYTATRHARKERPDVALVMNVANGYFLKGLSRSGIPTLVNVDGIEWSRAKWGRLAKTAFKRGAQLTAKWGDELVYDSREIARFWKQEFGRDGLFIPYGGDPVPDLAVEEGYSSGGYVLMVARFVPENTVGEFLVAARKLSRAHKVVIVGSTGYGGALDDEARRLAEEAPNVAWLGHISDDNRLHALWKHSGAYFHGHSVGGTNPALVQAMAAGAPIVARDTVFNREVLGEAGTFVPAEADQIASSLDRMLRDGALQDAARKLSLERARDEYTWQSVNERYAQALEHLIKTGTKKR